jgi:hypothetical protein
VDRLLALLLAGDRPAEIFSGKPDSFEHSDKCHPSPGMISSTSDDNLERTGLRSPAEDVVRLDHLVEHEMVTHELFGIYLV